MHAKTIRDHIDTLVVGQETAKRKLSVLLSMHLAWNSAPNKMHPSPNAFVVGPTGSGKTHSIGVACSFLRLPFVSVDSTSFVPSGIKGLQVEEVLASLVNAAREIRIANNPAGVTSGVVREDVELASKGIIFLDEFDKLAARESELAHFHTDVQRRLLKLIEGATLRVAETSYVIDTAGILILAGGAFHRIDHADIRRQRTPMQRRRAQADPNAIVSSDLIAYGFMPELVARLPVIVQYKELDAAALLAILRNERISPLQVWTQHFARLGKQVVYSDDFLNEVVSQALTVELGARGLQQVIFPLLIDVVYRSENSEAGVVNVTAEVFSGL